MTAKAKQTAEAGRPAGSKNPTAKQKVQRNLAGIYDATLRSALGGDAEAARLCFEIAQHPDEFPDPES